LGAIVQVRASGGGTKSPLWRQILASVLEAELTTVGVVEGAAYGAALLAGVGAGVWSDVATACEEVVRLSEVTNPNERQVVIYRRMYPLYRELYPALKSTFQKIE
jgi:xylulokinase